MALAVRQLEQDLERDKRMYAEERASARRPRKRKTDPAIDRLFEELIGGTK